MCAGVRGACVCMLCVRVDNLVSGLETTVNPEIAVIDSRKILSHTRDMDTGEDDIALPGAAGGGAAKAEATVTERSSKPELPWSEKHIARETFFFVTMLLPFAMERISCVL